MASGKSVEMGKEPEGGNVKGPAAAGGRSPQRGPGAWYTPTRRGKQCKMPNANFTKFTALHNRDSYNHAFKLVVLLRHLGALPPDLTGVPPFDPLRTSIV